MCPTLCDSMDCSPPGSSVHGVFQARILEWTALPFSRGFSWCRNWTGLPHCRQILTVWATREACSNGPKQSSNLGKVSSIRKGLKLSESVSNIFHPFKHVLKRVSKVFYPFKHKGSQLEKQHLNHHKSSQTNQEHFQSKEVFQIGKCLRLRATVSNNWERSRYVKESQTCQEECQIKNYWSQTCHEGSWASQRESVRKSLDFVSVSNIAGTSQVDRKRLIMSRCASNMTRSVTKREEGSEIYHISSQTKLEASQNNKEGLWISQ